MDRYANYHRAKSAKTGFMANLKSIFGDIWRGQANSNAKRRSSFNQPRTIVRKHRPDYRLLIGLSLLLMVSLIVIYSISPLKVNIENYYNDKQVNPLYYFVKHLIILSIGLVGFFVISKAPLKIWYKFSVFFLGLGFGLAILLVILGWSGSSLASSVNGAVRWLKLPLIGTLQVSEVLKFGLLTFLAAFWSMMVKQNKFNSLYNLIYSSVFIIPALLLIVIAQNDLGTAISLAMMVGIMAWSAGINKKIAVIAIIVMILAGSLFIAVKPHRRARLATFLQGDNAPTNDQNRHSFEARIAIGSGGAFGLGVGKSIQAAGYLPELINDSVFAIVAEMFGFFLTVGIVLAFVYC